MEGGAGGETGSSFHSILYTRYYGTSSSTCDPMMSIRSIPVSLRRTSNLPMYSCPLKHQEFVIIAVFVPRWCCTGLYSRYTPYYSSTVKFYRKSADLLYPTSASTSTLYEVRAILYCTVPPDILSTTSAHPGRHIHPLRCSADLEPLGHFLHASPGGLSSESLFSPHMYGKVALNLLFLSQAPTQESFPARATPIFC